MAGGDGKRSAKNPGPIGNRGFILKSCRFYLDNIFDLPYTGFVSNRTSSNKHFCTAKTKKPKTACRTKTVSIILIIDHFISFLFFLTFDSPCETYLIGVPKED